MIDRIENKFIDKLDRIDGWAMQSAFDCSWAEAGELIQNYFLHRKRIKFSLDISTLPNITTLGSVKTIDGNFYANITELEDLGDLRLVNGRVQVMWTKLENTCKLTYCEGLQVAGIPFKEFKKITSLNGNLTVIDTNIEDLGSINEVGGDLTISSNGKITSLGRVRNIIGGLKIIHAPNLESLGKVVSIGGSLDIRNSSIKNFGELTSLGGCVIINKSEMANFNENDTNMVDLTSAKTFIQNMPKMYLIVMTNVNNLERFNLLITDG